MLQQQQLRAQQGSVISKKITASLPRQSKSLTERKHMKLGLWGVGGLRRTNAEFKWATSCFQSLSSWPSVQISQRNILDTKFQNAGHQSAAANDTTSILYNKRFSAVTSTQQHSFDPELHHCITKLDLFLLLFFCWAYFRSWYEACAWNRSWNT